jgi:hypothetical protein
LYIPKGYTKNTKDYKATEGSQLAPQRLDQRLAEPEGEGETLMPAASMAAIFDGIAFAARNDRAGMPHAAAERRRKLRFANHRMPAHGDLRTAKISFGGAVAKCSIACRLCGRLPDFSGASWVANAMTASSAKRTRVHASHMPMGKRRQRSS